MDIRPLTETFAVSPQIGPEDAPAIAAAGFRTVICNRPDDEVLPGARSAMVRAAIEAAGLAFVDNPIAALGVSRADIRRQREAIDGSSGPVLAYCASGTRSTIAWMFAALDETAPDELIAIALRAGYPLSGLRQQLELTVRAR